MDPVSEESKADNTANLQAFDCQGSRWCRVGKKNLIHDEQPGTITGTIRADGVDYLPRLVDSGWTGVAVMFSHVGGEVLYLPQNVSLPIRLKSKEYEVFTVVPVKELKLGTRFAPTGLLKMFNSVAMKVRGCGLLGAYLSARPKRVRFESEEAEFEYEEARGLLTVTLSVTKAEMYKWDVVIDL